MARLVPLLAVAALTACGGSHFSGPSLRSVCGRASAATPRWLRTSDGLRLYAVAEGRGDVTVVLAHESGGQGLCGWLPTMEWLAAHHVATLAFDFRGTYPSALPPARVQYAWARDLQAAVDAAHAKRLVLVGASFGGAAAIALAPTLHGVDGVVSLSGEQRLPSSRVDAIDNAARLRVPLLVVASADDGYLDGAAARRLVDRTGSKEKRAVVFPGRRHGWEILDELPRARQLVLGWITRRQPSASSSA